MFLFSIYYWEIRTIHAINLPLRELWRRLNQEGGSVIAEKYYPSVNNYCSKCKEELYDDGRSYESPCCKAKTTKMFKKSLEIVPCYVYKHILNEIFHQLKKVYFSE